MVLLALYVRHIEICIKVSCIRICVYRYRSIKMKRYLFLSVLVLVSVSLVSSFVLTNTKYSMQLTKRSKNNKNNRFYYFHNCKTDCTIWTVTSTTRFKCINNDDNNQYYNNQFQTQQQQQQRSIGDVVKNLHGGKYQFDNKSGLGMIGQQFAESMYACTPDNSMLQHTEEKVFDDTNLPKWVHRLGSTVPKQISGTINFSIQDLESSSSQIIQIHNEERTWERYYSKIIMSPGSDNINELEWDIHYNYFTILVGQQGMLAPRGGVSGISDTATIIVRPVQNFQYESYQLREYWLIVGTEEANWCYNLRLH
jgi:hypothetical protein